ncbi:4Fe-4S dicluster domain-containing protein [Sedimentibacter hydroxybenzoicus DSM 7310]|uniref:4Fe-4S dicluster domain-containing protein n=1 Tax=Sedimentibacter hydroxybenzoicus DSM 7310 TaxID=1123245 RepID=A0A974GVU6_SEDHY|nr:4Fe-4S dicluster domain-containing protein [Sedimentibacter hydroxybenzoicus]NYB73671.1 4Fe-4S dicluster domain-containing protein [Sedimentibacter hydroxybenzoicus DSM 7310]
MKRKIVKIHEDRCNGCGLCVNACHEGALEIINGKAVLLSDVYCDGLGDCLPNCPVDAIEIIEREAEEFDKELVERRMEERKQNKEAHSFGCPGQRAKEIVHKKVEVKEEIVLNSELRQWPVQLKLVSPMAQYFNGSHILVAADCTAYAYANIHNDFMRGKITLIGCPKLDDADYSEKLTEILKHNDVKSLTVLRMEVPCCSGIVNAVKKAIINSGKLIPWGYKVISTDGSLLDS